MSRFKPSRHSGGAVYTGLPVPPRTPVNPTVTLAPATPAVAKTLIEATPNIFQKLGLWTLIAYLLSSSANEWTLRLFGGKAYLSSVGLVLLPIFFLISGTPVRSLKDRLGWLWLGFLGCMVLATPFSVWKSASVLFLWSYVPRSYLLFFYVTAFAITLTDVRKIMYTMLFSDAVLLLTCWKFGISNDIDRFYIPESLLYTNANELALALTLAITHFLFLMYVGNIPKHVVTAVAIAIALFYMLKCASRGCTLALIALLGVIFLLSKKKALVVFITAPILVLALALTPSNALHRLKLIGYTVSMVGAENAEDLSAIQSQLERQELFKRSLYHTFKHPLLGVGPNQFIVAESGDKEKAGQRSNWLGTHNSYTQVSSECGIPAFLCYAAVIVLSGRTALRVHKRARNSLDPRLREVAALAFALFTGLIVYAVATTFFHMAYTGALPMLAGMTLVLQMNAKPLLEETACSPARA